MDKISDVSFKNITESIYIRPFRIQYTQDGKKKLWDCAVHHDSVAILVHNISRDVFVFVKQFRPAVYYNQAESLGAVESGRIDSEKAPGRLGVTYEMCAGIVDKDCSVEQIAKEEVLEECGYDVPLRHLEKITVCRSGVGTSGTLQTLFYAKVTDAMRVGEGGGNPTEGELIEVIEVPVSESLAFVMDETVETPVGLLFGITWYMACKQNQKGCKSGGCS
ncbi:hypothetical protein NP493_864g01060 [Ridgeia piscesae]|uniref:Uridine diphosphate glucose pyrophosphatase NUDT14 n=1 Tax=Ridgeia piscesae TaxID=27915 RepID=A0AAD9KLD4_RIDPI|nr:hypothetical protein NP493_864g01060 [Ridgeia piscesae]